MPRPAASYQGHPSAVTASPNGLADDGAPGENDLIAADVENLGGGGDDTVNGGSGNDVVHGGYGNDVMYGGSHEDGLYGEAGADWLYGQGGFDILDGGTEIDLCEAGAEGASKTACELTFAIT